MPSLETILSISLPLGTGIIFGALIVTTQRFNSTLLKRLDELISLLNENQKALQLKPRAVIHVRVRKRTRPPEEQAPDATEGQG
jgi:hypothetical protein